MVVAATGAIIAGLAMAGAGTAAAVKANKIKTSPKGVTYGGSPEELYNTENQYATGIHQGQILRNAGIQDMAGVGGAAAAQAAYGQDMMDDSFAAMNSGKMTNAQYMAQLWKQSQQGQNALQASSQFDRAARQNTALAQVGGPMAMRQAMAANSDAAAQAEQQRAIADASMAGVYAQQAQAADNARRDHYMQRIGMGAGLMQGGMDTQLAAYNPAVQAGLATEENYLGAEQNVQQAQLGADLDYERRRQAEKQRRSQNLWGLGSSLITGGGKVMQGGMGGGSGGGGGGGGYYGGGG